MGSIAKFGLGLILGGILCEGEFVFASSCDETLVRQLASASELGQSRTLEALQQEMMKQRSAPPSDFYRGYDEFFASVQQSQIDVLKAQIEQHLFSYLKAYAEATGKNYVIFAGIADQMEYRRSLQENPYSFISQFATVATGGYSDWAWAPQSTLLPFGELIFDFCKRNGLEAKIYRTTIEGTVEVFTSSTREWKKSELAIVDFKGNSFHSFGNLEISWKTDE